MANNRFDLGDYVDVATRIAEFHARYPEGSLQSYREPYMLEANGKHFVVYAAAAYRTPDDPRPGVGWAWEPVPGGTPYTRESELMNAETSAWGRAIVALGFDTKHVASRNEVLNRQHRDEAGQHSPADEPASPVARMRDEYRKPGSLASQLDDNEPAQPGAVAFTRDDVQAVLSVLPRLMQTTAREKSVPYLALKAAMARELKGEISAETVAAYFERHPAATVGHVVANALHDLKATAAR